MTNTEHRVALHLSTRLAAVVFLCFVPRIQALISLGFREPHLIVAKRSISTHLQSMNPEQNPQADKEAFSKAGVSYAQVKSGLDLLFPPSDLDKRTALSRTDGYWPYLKKGLDPPQQLVYGEFDFYFFASLVDRACELADTERGEQSWKDKVFVDIGSGTGRLVFASAALHPWKMSRGIELLPSIHQQAVDTLEQLERNNDTNCILPTTQVSFGNDNPLKISPVDFVCGSFEDPYIDVSDADLIFFFSTCMPKNMLNCFAEAVGRQCKPGSLIITTEYSLPLEGTVPPVEGDDRIPSGSYKLELVEEVKGWSWVQGGDATAFIHRVESSLWREGQGAWERPVLTKEEICYRAAMALESRELETERFLRGVYNNMMFYGLPERFYARLRDRLS